MRVSPTVKTSRPVAVKSLRRCEVANALAEVLWVRYEDRGLWRRGRTRHLTVLGEIGAGEVNYDEESI